MSDVYFGVDCALDFINSLLELLFTADNRPFKTLRLVSKSWEKMMVKFGMNIYKKQKYLKERLYKQMTVKRFVIERMVEIFKHPARYHTHTFLLNENDPLQRIGSIAKTIDNRGSTKWLIEWGFPDNYPSLVLMCGSVLERLQYKFWRVLNDIKSVNAISMCVGHFLFDDLPLGVNILSQYSFDFGWGSDAISTSLYGTMYKLDMEPDFLWLYSFFDKAIQEKKVTLE